MVQNKHSTCATPRLIDKEAIPKTVLVANNVINIYSNPDTSAEVTTQAILGASLTVKERKGDFVLVSSEDSYTGWAYLKHLVADENYSPGVCPVITSLFADVYCSPDADAELMTRLVLSTRIYPIESKPVHELAQVRLPDGSESWIAQRCFASPSPMTNTSNWSDSKDEREILIKMYGERVVATAKRLIGVPYLWGGCTPFGIDCSGFTQLSYKVEGVQLLRDTYLQAKDRRFIQIGAGLPFNRIELAAGDLVIFLVENNRGSGDHGMHIGVALGDGSFIHSSGRQRNFGVYIDSCSEPFYVERFAKAMRLSADADLSMQKA